MTPSHAVKAGVRYRYYISCRETGSAEDSVAAIVRVPAPDVEEAVLKALAGAGDGTRTSGADVTSAARANTNYQLACETNAVPDVVERVDIRPSEIEVRLTAGEVT